MTGAGVLFLFSFLLLSQNCCARPLCTNSSLPFKLHTPMEFCSYNGTVCCDSADILLLEKQFQALNVSDTACASILKSILCAKCDQFSAELFRIASGLRTVPVMCESSHSEDGATLDFCTKVWDSCRDQPISHSLFSPTIQGEVGMQFDPSPSAIADHWHSRSDFCEAFGGSSHDAVCFSGEPVSFDKIEDHQAEALCLEKIGIQAYLNLIPHPDGSNRAFLSTQEGKIWLATVPEEGSNSSLQINEAKPFLDVTDQVLFDSEYGLMGMAFHPQFTENGRFFLSFSCDKLKQPGCSGRCTCNTDVDCDPSKLSADNGAQPCQYHYVVAEFTTNGTSLKPSLAESANPSEVRRILTMGFPYRGHAGQILFGPEDGYLYIMIEDGAHRDDPLNLAQNKKSLLGKILRIDIDNIPSAKEVYNLGLWGNYSVPKDNPYSDIDKELGPEIWALGFKNPWRCSFDAERPHYFLCGDCGQDQYEEVDIITKGGNYGWHDYEGPFLVASAGEKSSISRPIFPVMGYDHSELDTSTGSASMTGGYFYRSKTDPCMYGRYLYADLYGGAFWGGKESPENSGKFSTVRLSFTCAQDSPIQCSFVGQSPVPVIGYVLSLGEDDNKDVYILASSGVYRVARPSRCNYSCYKENKASFFTRKQHSHTSTSSKLLRSWSSFEFLLLAVLVTLPDFIL